MNSPTEALHVREMRPKGIYMTALMLSGSLAGCRALSAEQRLRFTWPASGVALLLTATLALPLASAEPLASIPNPRVRNSSWVTDTAGALRPETVARLNETLASVERTTGVEMAVVAIRSLDGLSVEEAAEKLFRAWGIGKKNTDNGLLLLWSTGDRRVRVEVGYGLEGVLPDGRVGAILDTYLIPRFKNGEFDVGIVAGVDALLAAARSETVSLPAAATDSNDAESGGRLSRWLPALSAIPLAIGSLIGLRRWRRYRGRRCPRCHTRMRLLSDSEDDEHLQEGQLAEERIASVDYDVWTCPACSHRFTLRYPKWASAYAECPQCAHRTKSTKRTVISAATTRFEGTAKVVEQCAFCSFSSEYEEVLPRLTSSDSSSGGSGGGSSFGGGRSGGGGASRGY